MENKGTKGKQGFASMDPEKQREIAQRGGQRAHSLGKAHRFTQDEARKAGRKGGQALSRNRAHMAEIGRSGAKRSGRWRSKAQDQNSKKERSS